MQWSEGALKRGHQLGNGKYRRLFLRKNMTMISGEFMKYTGLMNKKIEKGILAYTERMLFRF